MRILLVQFRPDPVIAEQEFRLVVKYSGQSAEDFARLDATREPVVLSALDAADALILGGSGDFLISRGDIPEIRSALRPFLAEARARRMPTLGICFGGQLMTEAFGGTVELDEARAEMGTFEILKTPEGDRDPLFAQLPATFDAQLGHKDHFTRLPPGAAHLASSARSPFQAWAFPGEPLYALTFHPELDVEGTLSRIDYYADAYAVTPEFRANLAASLRESPEANGMIRLWITLWRNGWTGGGQPSGFSP